MVDVRLADDWFFLYYDGKWRTYPPAWFAFSPQAYKKEQPKTPAKRPNLPLLVQLIREEILTQSEASQLPTTPREPEAEPELDTDSVLVMPLAVALQRESRQIQRVAAAHAWQKRHRLHITVLVVILVSPFVLTGGLILGLVIYQQQHEAALRAQVSALVHQRYYTVAPGEQCASGPGRWSNDPPPSIFQCLDEGLEIIQPDTSQEAGTFLSSDPGDYDHVGLTGDFFPAHYQMQVNVTFGEDPNDVCASLWVHVQKNERHQEFDICATGDWLEGHCDAYCEHFTLLARGVLPDPQIPPPS
ncbi:hypothetical protein KTAU_17580 [Thermogemmatispora aurantia]|uniref:Uncharacterized protein n=1 Tax=Thermogemmatispora aurantia TaxID=2045279 RepID=A0A5J4K8X7_9CHLR|nr:hypothetical protein [Thermogemmatispora aurantia]GER83121.1 hypothetical protein KTAU_17580 [Thermogemmatispora aurantia]